MSGSGSETEASESPQATQLDNSTNRTYVSVFLFNYDLDSETPFSWVYLNQFEGSDFPFNLINGRLSLDERLKPREMSKLPGSKYCVFAKCEEGRKLNAK